jgi:hypothetical protein
LLADDCLILFLHGFCYFESDFDSVSSFDSVWLMISFLGVALILILRALLGVLLAVLQAFDLGEGNISHV